MRNRRRARLDSALLDRSGSRSISAPRSCDEPQQVARRFGFGERGLAQRHTQFLVDPGDQLDAGQAVQTEVAFERMVQPE